jgi:hypothetical protein
VTAPAFFTLERTEVGPAGAFGRLLHLGKEIAKTLERTYEDPGEPVVKIPPGRHRTTITRFIRGQYTTYEVHVYGHSRLLFHKGNFETDSDGCILLGESIGTLNGRPAVLNSGEAFERFMQCAAGAPEFYLEVI